MKERLDVHQTITDKIIAAIEAGADKPSLPWHRSGFASETPKNVLTGNFYNGINVLMLWAEAIARKYPFPIWGTYKQFQACGAQVRKGEKASLIIFYKQYDVTPEKEEDDGKRRVARASWVFNAAQVDGYEVETLPELPPIERLARAEAFVSSTGAVIRIGGDRAYYDRKEDYIQMPDENRFQAPETGQRTEDWYSVLSHELGHFSGAEKRLNRNLGNRFGDDAYAMEELVAELCSAFLCAELGISSKLRDDHAPYIAHWLKVMKGDKRAIFSAAAAASAAAKYLHGTMKE